MQIVSDEKHSYFLVGADIVPTEANAQLFARGDAESLVGDELLQLLCASSHNVFNLESPLTDELSPIPKCGPNLAAPRSCVAGYQALNMNLLSLANNHIMDQGASGLFSTMKVLDSVGISHFGAGTCYEEACNTVTFGFAGNIVGVYACAEHEFSIAGEQTPGANPFDPLWSLDHVVTLAGKCDFTVVLYHGGKEHYRYPSPQLRRTCRRLVDKGADLVVCQHSHCIGCEEQYGDGTIVYGQGNFLFDLSDSELWQTGLLVRVSGDLSISYVPVVKCGETVRLAKGSEYAQIIGDFERRSAEIREDGFIEQAYAEFATMTCDSYLSALRGRSPLVARAVNKLSNGRMARFFNRVRYGKGETLRVVNYLECEAHRELALEGLRQIMKSQIR